MQTFNEWPEGTGQILSEQTLGDVDRFQLPFGGHWQSPAPAVCQYARMKSITVSLPDSLARLAAREAERRGTSVSNIVRLSLAQLLRPEDERRIPWAAVVHEPVLVCGASIDKALDEDWQVAITGHR